jgi:antitoxin YefM
VRVLEHHPLTGPAAACRVDARGRRSGAPDGPTPAAVVSAPRTSSRPGPLPGDHFTITRNGRADVMLISVAEYESMRETLDLLSDDEALADLRQSRDDFASGDTFSMDEIRGELERRRGRSA